MSPDLKDVFDDAGRTPPHGRGYDADEVVRRGARIRTRRRTLTGAATLGVAAIVVGGSIALIGQPLNKGTAIEPGGSPSTSPTEVSPSPTTGSPSPDRTTPAPGPGPCQIRELTMTLGTGRGAAGTTYYPVVITADPGNCWLGGLPTLYAVTESSSGSGEPDLVGPATSIVQTDPAGSVLMQRSSAASFLVGIATSDNYDPIVCKPVTATALRVKLGHPTIDVPLPEGTTVCSGDVNAFGNQLQVGAIVAGNSGQ